MPNVEKSLNAHTFFSEITQPNKFIKIDHALNMD